MQIKITGDEDMMVMTNEVRASQNPEPFVSTSSSSVIYPSPTKKMETTTIDIRLRMRAYYLYWILVCAQTPQMLQWWLEHLRAQPPWTDVEALR